MFNLIYFLLIGLAAGWLSGQILKGRDFGLWGNLLIGCVGSLVGGFLFQILGFTSYGLLAQLVVATVGALVLLFGLRQLRH